MNEYELINNLPDHPQPLFIRRTDVIKLFGISARMLENLAMERKGPPYFRVGKFALYNVEDLIRWVTRYPVKTNSRGM